MHKSSLLLLGTVIAACVFTGCTNIATFDYVGAPGTMIRFQPAVSANKTVAVLPFEDQRGTKYYDPAQANQAYRHPDGEHGSFYIGFLPLFPAGYVKKEEPENSEDFVSLGRFHFSPSQDLANASFLSLKQSNLFASVTRANTLEQTQADYIWRGTVTDT